MHNSNIYISLRYVVRFCSEETIITIITLLSSLLLSMALKSSSHVMGTIPLKTKETETVINNYVNKKLLYDQTRYNIYIFSKYGTPP